jgi:hypothetical protein
MHCRNLYLLCFQSMCACVGGRAVSHFPDTDEGDLVGGRWVASSPPPAWQIQPHDGAPASPNTACAVCDGVKLMASAGRATQARSGQGRMRSGTRGGWAGCSAGHADVGGTRMHRDWGGCRYVSLSCEGGYLTWTAQVTMATICSNRRQRQHRT